MQRMLLVFMIALMPLRGLVGDAMAMSMLNVPASGSPSAGMAGNAPCPGHASAPAPAHDAGHDLPSASKQPSDHPQAHESGHTHAVCDLCNGPAMARTPLATTLLPVTQLVHGALAERFASFEPNQGIKPPIS